MYTVTQSLSCKVAKRKKTTTINKTNDNLVPRVSHLLALPELKGLDKHLFLYATNGGGVWLECKGTRHQWSGPEAKEGTRLGDRYLDGCYRNRRHSEALCKVTLAEVSGEGETGNGEGTRGMKGEFGNY